MSKMIFILGSTGYIGKAVVAEANRRGLNWCPIFTKEHTFNEIDGLITDNKPSLVINCAAFIPQPSVAECDNHIAETCRANAIFPALLALSCARYKIPLMQLSTGCLFDENREYTETDTPIRGFGGHCGIYVGTKLVAEHAVLEYPDNYVLRLRLPFDEVDHPRNYLTKLTKFDQVYKHLNSLTHRGDFAKALFDLWMLRAAPGIYHCVNPDLVCVEGLLELMVQKGLIAKMPRTVKHSSTGCWLSAKKLESAGVQMRRVGLAIKESLENWHTDYHVSTPHNLPSLRLHDIKTGL
jgi:dTDP-4-dehydrorhamnose reductase